ncbi:MAG: LolA family protein [Spirochaetales bacterium]
MVRKSFRLAAILLVAFSVANSVGAQDILTAEEFFANVSANYADIQDYVADMSWQDGSGTMTGSLLYKRPNKLRIEFSRPSGQILVSDGSVLKIYQPGLNVVLQQDLSGLGGGPAGLVSEEGLALMRRNYAIAYLEGPEPVPLDEESSLLVTKLRLDRRQRSESFRELILSVDQDGFIRRIEGTRVDWQNVQMDLNEIRIDQGLSDRVFEEDPDPSASVNENFLSDPEG